MLQLCGPQVHYVFNYQPVYGKDGYLFAGLPVDLLAFEAKVEPGTGYEIYRLTNVDASRKTCMIGAREGKDVLPRHLQGFINFHLLLVEVSWVDHRIDIEQNIGVLLE